MLFLTKIVAPPQILCKKVVFFEPHWDIAPNMYKISIPAIWNVIWGQTNLFLILDRPPNPLNQKDQDSKIWIFD